MSALANQRSEWTHHRLFEFAKSAIVKIFVHPYATVCDLYCGAAANADKWDSSQISHYIGIVSMNSLDSVDVAASVMEEMQEAWESHSKSGTAEFFEADPCAESFMMQLQEKANQPDLVCCLQNLQLCFETEESAKQLLHNVSSLLKPGGYFFGITPDSSTIWAKYQKNVEAYHNRSGSLKPNIVPNCIRSESYMISFEVEEDKFPSFGKKYQLKFAHEMSAETHCLVHFPSLIRLAREAGLEYVEIQNLTEFYDDNKYGISRTQFAGLIMNAGPNLVDPRGRLLPRSYDVLGLYTTFIFQKPNPDVVPPIASPALQDDGYNLDEREWQVTGWRDDELIVHTELPAPPIMVSRLGSTTPLGLGKISEQKGILGPGPADLRFAEAI